MEAPQYGAKRTSAGVCAADIPVLVLFIRFLTYTMEGLPQIEPEEILQ